MPSQPYLYLEEGEDPEADRLLQDLIALGPTSIPFQATITKGQTPDSIMGIARELPAGLIVMGTHGRRGVNHMLLGSTAERVIARSPCPVLTARDTDTNTIFTIQGDAAARATAQVLVPIDFSWHSLYTLEQAYRMLDQIPVTLNLLHIVVPGPWDDMRGTGDFNVPEFPACHRILGARQRLHALISPQVARRVHLHVRMGPVVKEITSLADEIQARLIIMGIAPKGVGEELDFGVAAYDVLRSSRCPVWIVPELRSSYAEEEDQFGVFPYPSP